MTPKKYFLIGMFTLIGGSLLLSACNLPGPGPSESDLILTSVAQTITANQTAQAPEPEKPTPTGTIPPEMTPTPTSENTQTPTAAPTKTEQSGPCNLAVFVEHAALPPNVLVDGGEDYVKSWRVTNAGTCTWDSDYKLIFVRGKSMGVPVTVPLSEIVLPNETTDLTIIITTPTTEGLHAGYWALMDPQGQIVPFENLTDDELQVSVRIKVLDEVVFDFIDKYCQAQWKSQVVGDLDCPDGTLNSAQGYVLKLEKGELESGKSVTDPILVTRPDNGDTDGFIRGIYPAIRVEAGDVFRATIGCASGATRCNLYFDLQYQIGNGAIQTLETWHEVYDGKVRDVEVDLTDLAGVTVKLILRVRNINTDQDNEGYWFNPRIMR